MRHDIRDGILYAGGSYDENSSWDVYPFLSMCSSCLRWTGGSTCGVVVMGVGTKRIYLYIYVLFILTHQLVTFILAFLFLLTRSSASIIINIHTDAVPQIASTHPPHIQNRFQFPIIPVIVHQCIIILILVLTYIIVMHIAIHNRTA